jgi:hypothetical protein
MGYCLFLEVNDRLQRYSKFISVEATLYTRKCWWSLRFDTLYAAGRSLLQKPLLLVLFLRLYCDFVCTFCQMVFDNITQQTPHRNARNPARSVSLFVVVKRGQGLLGVLFFRVKLILSEANINHTSKGIHHWIKLHRHYIASGFERSSKYKNWSQPQKIFLPFSVQGLLADLSLMKRAAKPSPSTINIEHTARGYGPCRHN